MDLLNIIAYSSAIARTLVRGEKRRMRIRMKVSIKTEAVDESDATLANTRLISDAKKAREMKPISDMWRTPDDLQNRN